MQAPGCVMLLLVNISTGMMKHRTAYVIPPCDGSSSIREDAATVVFCVVVRLKRQLRQMRRYRSRRY
ncbi:MAG: hypothetical protein ABFC84_02480 [Veillonellales bacterium]